MTTRRLLIECATGVALVLTGGTVCTPSEPVPEEVRVPEADASHQQPTPSAEALSFTRDVVPVLTKLGCNAGSCHGSFQGRGGFRLSLLGFDPAADYAALVSEGRGRRVFPAAPAMSLVLRKPTLQVPHGGGLRLDSDSLAYHILHGWIAQGMPSSGLEGLSVARLDLDLTEAMLQPGEERRLSVQAIWSDGVVTDATPWAQFDTTNDGVAPVDAAGTIRAVGPGRAAITVRFMGQVAAAVITVPYPPLAGGVDGAQLRRRAGRRRLAAAWFASCAAGR
jgi:hypothetical protein